MQESDVFILADRALEAVVSRLSPEHWTMRVPATFATMRTSDEPPLLREVIGYHAYDDAWVPDMLAGRTMDEVGVTTYPDDPLGDDPAVAFSALVDRAVEAARSSDPERIVHTSFGDFSTREYFWQINSFRGLRAWEIARICGFHADLPAELVQGLWDEISPHAEEWRAMGIFGPAVPVPEDAPLLTRVVGITGRDPSI